MEREGIQIGDWPPRDHCLNLYGCHSVNGFQSPISDTNRKMDSVIDMLALTIKMV